MITVVIPVFNEAACLEALMARLGAMQGRDGIEYEFLFVDDGSRDRSLELIRSFAGSHSFVRYITFSRNFGHESATTAGMDHATGEAVVIMDSDLQDPPEVIGELVRKWREGYAIVYARRRVRKGESAFKRLTSWLFYRIIGMVSDVEIPPDTGDFRLMDQKVVRQFRRCREQSRFVRGLVAWTGFKQAAVLYERDERYGGDTKYSVGKLLLLAVDAAMGFSQFPLRVGVVLGLGTCVFCFVMMGRIVLQRLTGDLSLPGYALEVTGIFFLGGVQLMILGLLGEYIGRVFRQAQGRPLYIVGEKSESLPKGEEGLASD